MQNIAIGRLKDLVRPTWTPIDRVRNLSKVYACHIVGCHSQSLV